MAQSIPIKKDTEEVNKYKISEVIMNKGFENDPFRIIKNGESI